MQRALVIVDMVNDLLDPRGSLYCGDRARDIIPFIQGKLAEFHATGEPVFFACDAHAQDDPEFRHLPVHAIRGSQGAGIIPELVVGANDVVIPKRRRSALCETNLADLLRERKVELVEVVGVCTSISVMDTVGDLRNLGLEVVVWRHGVADFDAEAHEFSLKRMEKVLGAMVR